MWSGPRNLSTAMMYSFGARGDFDVLDEPFYGSYLAKSGTHHPMREEIIGSMQCDASKVVQSFKKTDKPFLYSKQMTHHMIPDVPRDWFSQTKHVFLIRHPVRVVASYARKRKAMNLDDIGFKQQAEIFDEVVDLTGRPIVVDSFDIRREPEKTLRNLCLALQVPWSKSMLAWPAGGHPADGVWAKHWYGAVHASTCFAGPENELPLLEPKQQAVADAAMPYYEAMAVHKI